MCEDLTHMSGYDSAIEVGKPPLTCPLTGEPLHTRTEVERGISDEAWAKQFENPKVRLGPVSREKMEEAIALAPEPLKKAWEPLLGRQHGLDSDDTRAAMVVTGLRVASMAISYGSDANRTTVLRVDSAMLAVVVVQNFAKAAGWTNVAQGLNNRFHRELRSGILRMKERAGRPGTLGIHAPFDQQWNDFCRANRNLFFDQEKEGSLFWRYFHESDLRYVVNLLQSAFGDALIETQEGKLLLLPSMPLPALPKAAERHVPKGPRATNEIHKIDPAIDALRVGDKVVLPDGTESIIQFIDGRKSKIGVADKRGPRNSYTWFGFVEIETVNGKKVAEELYRQRVQQATRDGYPESVVAPTKMPPKIPAGAQLKSNQLANLDFIETRRRVIVADEPGLGKTISALLAIETPAIIVCPAHLKANWVSETTKWRPDLNLLAVSGGKTPELKAIRNADTILINYEIVEPHLEWLMQFRPKTIVADEAHYLKTLTVERDKEGFFKPADDSSIRASAFYRLHFAAPKLVLLTGTPLLNRVKELFPLLHMVDSREWSNQKEFQKKYCAAGYSVKGGRQIWDANGRSNTQELHEKIKGKYMIRHTKADILTELPPKTRRTVELPLDPVTAKVYQEMQEDFIAWLERQEGGRKRVERAMRAEVLVRLTSLRRTSAFGKAPALALVIRDFFASTAGTRPLVVMGVFKEPLLRLARFIEKFNQEFEQANATPGADTDIPRQIRYAMYTGAETPKQRAKTVEEFQSGNIDVVFYSIPLGTGTTLTASSDVFFIERLWRPSDQVQAEDRVHRIGQSKGVMITYYDATGTVDTKMGMLLLDKTDAAAEVIDGLQLSRNESLALVYGEMTAGLRKGFAGSSFEEMTASDILDEAYAASIDLDRQIMNADGAQEVDEDQVLADVRRQLKEIEAREKARAVKKNRHATDRDEMIVMNGWDEPIYLLHDED